MQRHSAVSYDVDGGGEGHTSAVMYSVDGSLDSSLGARSAVSYEVEGAFSAVKKLDDVGVDGSGVGVGLLAV
jgi:hypothetical protein